MAAPDVPVATSATNTTDVDFSANWNSVSGATGYYLDVATDAGFTSFVSGFNNKDVSNVTTYSVTGLPDNTTYYFRVRSYNLGGTSASSNTISTITYNSEVIDWIARVVINTGSVSAGTKTAANVFVSAIKTASLRSKILRLNLYAGTGLAACLVPLIRDKGGLIDTATGFVSGDYSEATGLTGNGLTKSVDTGFSPPGDWTSDNDCFIGVYARTKTTVAAVLIGGLGGSSNADYIYMTGVLSYLSCHDTGNQFNYADSIATGHYAGSRIASNDTKLYRNGVSQASSATAGGTRSNWAIGVHAYQSPGGTFGYTDASLAGYEICKGLTPTETLAYYNALQAFQTALGRQV